MKKTIDTNLMTHIIRQYVNTCICNDVKMFGDQYDILSDYKTADDIYTDLMRMAWLGINMTTVYDWYDFINVKGIDYRGNGVFTTWATPTGYQFETWRDIEGIVNDIVRDLKSMTEDDRIWK